MPNDSGRRLLDAEKDKSPLPDRPQVPIADDTAEGRQVVNILAQQREAQKDLDVLWAHNRAMASAANGIAISDPRLPDCPLVYVNEAFLQMTGYSEAEVIGRNCRFLQGPGTDPDVVRDLREAIAAARPCQVAILNYRKNGEPFWNELTVSPVRDDQGVLIHFVGIQTDVTARFKRDKERTQIENRLRQFQFLSDNANDAFFLIDKQGNFVYVNAAACRSLGYSTEQLLRLCPVDIDPFYDDAAYKSLFQRLETEQLAPFESLQRRFDGTLFPIEASVTLLNDGIQTLLFSSCRDISTRKAAEQALQEANQRTAGLLESINDAFFALDHNWNFIYVNAQAELLLRRSRQELLGANFWDKFSDAVGSTFDLEYRRAVAQQIPVSFEEFYPPLERWLEVRAYPSPDGLSVYFHDISERKALEAERMHLAEREHRIAEQLQAALQPELPARVPGLAVTKYYSPALTDEAGVGGDFYDVFAVGPGRTALALGDLSGKGLEAAAQVSIVRNMLRAFLYSVPSVAEALSDLNRVLAENSLLSGFSTLFVGVFDAPSRRLTFVNCGQEPALLRRGATGQVEPLASTGPVLGAFENAHYSEEAVTLSRGDAVAIFSDGMTEIGPSRTAMLGITGVSALFSAPIAENQTAAEKAEILARLLIEGVDSAAEGGVMRDDVCLLVCVAED
jgi:PAS domain S-box-containing protein